MILFVVFGYAMMAVALVVPGAAAAIPGWLIGRWLAAIEARIENPPARPAVEPAIGWGLGVLLLSIAGIACWTALMMWADRRWPGGHPGASFAVLGVGVAVALAGGFVAGKGAGERWERARRARRPPGDPDARSL